VCPILFVFERVKSVVILYIYFSFDLLFPVIDSSDRRECIWNTGRLILGGGGGGEMS
jgi:hypothetical protein